MSDRSVFSALSFFVVIVVGLSFYPGNAALAVEQEHGNPGQFIDNIRKGISGLSRYFWSPKAQMPSESAEPPAKSDKTIAPVTKVPATDTKKATKAKPAMATRAAIVKKSADKPGQMIKPDNQMARVPASPKTMFESKTAVDHKNKLAAPKKASGSPLKAHAQPNSHLPAIAKAQKKNVRQPATGKFSSLVTPRTILKNETAFVKPAKPASPLAPADRKAKDKKPIGLAKQKAAIKPAATSVPSNISSKGVSVQPKTPSVKKAPVALIAAATTKKSRQQLVPNDKGTYIWVPNIGSKLSQRFGLTGIPAKGLHATGDLNRKDGRWAFAPKKRGMLPSIYGLSAEIHAAGDAGVWVGGGRNWVYVFDKNRSYGSIVGGTKAKKKTASKPVKPVASLKSGTLKSGAAVTQKPAIANNADKSTKNSKLAKPSKAQIKKATQKAARPQKGIEIKKAGKKFAQAPRQQTVTKPMTKRAGQAKAGPKKARNGKWSRVNNRWVFVPQSQPGQLGASNMRGLAEQVAKAPVTGGWVQRQNRWVYVAPQQGKTNPALNGAKRVAEGARLDRKMPATAKAANKNLGTARQTTENKAAKKPLASVLPAKSGIAVTKKPIAKMTPKASAATGLAEGPDAGEPQATKNQKIWVRKNNKWVYVFATPAAKVQQAPKANKAQGAPIVRRNSVPQNASGQGLETRAGQRPSGKFMFFVPGRIPGTGNWFIAPLQMLKKAKKIKHPAFAGGR